MMILCALYDHDFNMHYMCRERPHDNNLKHTMDNMGWALVGLVAPSSEKAGDHVKVI